MYNFRRKEGIYMIPITNHIEKIMSENQITRLIDGLYIKAKYNEILKEYSYPDASEVAEKLADKFSWTITPTGDTALLWQLPF